MEKIDDYRILRNKVSTLIDSAKKETYQTKVEEGKDDPRSIWKLFKQFGTCKNGSTKVNNFKINMNNVTISNDLDIANVFNDYFVNIPSGLKSRYNPPSLNFFKILLIQKFMMA